MSRALVIAIDGPSGSGKSTAGKELARRLGLRFIDTGAMYRAVALLVLRADDSEEALARAGALAEAAKFESVWDGNQHRLLVDGEDVSQAVRAPEVGSWSSRVSADPEVRRVLVACQQAWARDGGVIMDGRDIGTVVLPDADVKFFVDASLEERSRRRAGDESSADPRDVARAIAERDQRDRDRAVSPLRCAADAIAIDTTTLAAPEVVAAMLAQVRKRRPGSRSGEPTQG